MAKRTVHRTKISSDKPTPLWDEIPNTTLRICLIAALVLITLFAISILSAVPFLGNAFSAPEEIAFSFPMALAKTIGFAVLGSALALYPGWAIGWAISSKRRIYKDNEETLKSLLRYAVLLLLVCPPMIIGIGFTRVFDIFQGTIIEVISAPIVAVLSLLTIALPFAALTFEGAWNLASIEDENAAMAVGVDSSKTYGLFIRPAIIPSILPAFLLALARLIGEGASVYMIGASFSNNANTLASYAFLFRGQYPENAQGLALLLFLLAAVILAFTKTQVLHYIQPRRLLFDQHIYEEPTFEDAEDDEGELETSEEHFELDSAVQEDEKAVTELFAEISGPGVAYEDELSEEEKSYLDDFEEKKEAEELVDEVWQGSPGAPRNWEMPGIYWPKSVSNTADSTEESDHKDSRRDGVQPNRKDQEQADFMKTSGPFLRIRKAKDEE